MNTKHYVVFKELMKKGWIDRKNNPGIWSYKEDKECYDELENMGNELGFDLHSTVNRLYIVPRQDNELFLKNNSDYRDDISGGKAADNKHLYLLNYLAIYVIYLFYRGEGKDPVCLQFITRETIFDEFTKHCENVIKKELSMDEKKDDYSENFQMLAQLWIGKMEGSLDSKKMDEKYGVINKLIIKFKADDLFYEDDQKIKPTEKMNDLMPFVLDKKRVQLLNQWIEGV